MSEHMASRRQSVKVTCIQLGTIWAWYISGGWDHSEQAGSLQTAESLDGLVGMADDALNHLFPSWPEMVC